MSAENKAILRRWARRVLPWVLLSFAGWLILQEVEARQLVPDGTHAPLFVADSPDGTTMRLADHEGKVVVLNFWATWCPPCRAEAPVLSRAHRELGAQGAVIGASLDRGSLGQIEAAARDLGMSYPIVRPHPESLTAFRVNQLPTTYVIAPDGHIVASFIGEVDDDELGEAIAHAKSH